MQTIQVEINNDYGVIKLNRPEVRNAMNGEMIDEIILALDQLNENKQ